ncbi:MAG TPA: thiamine pyrophosphate-dependent enzyme [bacterium]|nr:thiamine pyrophosphate-dependent enzyme [bacterium]HQM51906.1 thiamine pyrophosphate-dependent enzyme [bacterium]
MAINLKELSKKTIPLSSGHRACAGCGSIITIKLVLMAAEDPIVCVSATGCMEVVTSIYPYTAWRVPFMHNAFENAAATLSGIETAYRALLKRGAISGKIKFIAFGGDGGTYDIGLQSLSGAMERGHDLLYVCYDNEAYMNTGIQRSGSTPFCAATSTAPVGAVSAGKKQFPKDLTKIMVAHRIPYVAQASPHRWQDLMGKVRKALAIEGPKFMNVISSCHRGWRVPMENSLDVCKLAVETCYWPLFEVENGVWKLNYRPRQKLPITEWIKHQKRFSHLMKPENQPLVALMQEEVDRRWNELLSLCGEKAG